MSKWTHPNTSAIPLLALALAAGSTAYAEDAHEPGWSGEVAIGYLQKSGNTRSTSFNGKSKATHEGEQWRNLFKLEGANESADEIRTSENYFAATQADYKLGENSYLFGLLEYTDDRFSGYNYEASSTFGYGYSILNEPDHLWNVDFGLGYRRSEVELSKDLEEEGIARFATQYKLKLSDTTVFEEVASAEKGEERTISKSLTSLKFKVNGNLWAGLAYEIKHSSNLPKLLLDDGSIARAKKSDRITSITLNYVF
ncbi:Protein of unknown function, DUF481 [gamma proteobacterium HdN1]|nr:Protein of unknown function, DUF481 [gamma proteobacterium HdN1]